MKFSIVTVTDRDIDSDGFSVEPKFGAVLATFEAAYPQAAIKLLSTEIAKLGSVAKPGFLECASCTACVELRDGRIVALDSIV